MFKMSFAWPVMAILLVKCSADQTTIDYLASSIHIQYNVIDNLESLLTFSGQLVLTNTGPDDVTDINWSLYFCSLKTFEPDSIDPDGAELGNTSLRVYRINGGFHKIEPSSSFPGFSAGSRLEVPFRGSSSQVEAAETMPNWYFSAADSAPRVCTNTADDDLSWVGLFNTSNQWKKSNLDTYDPYTGPVRLAMQNYTDLGGVPIVILPTPANASLNYDYSCNIGTGEWVVVAGEPSLRSDAQYLADMLNTVAIDVEFTPSSHYIMLVTEDAGTGHPRSGAYLMQVDDGNQIITVTATDSDGVFHGVQTLLSLYAASEEIPGGYVDDYPRFPYRGMHVDVSRNFHSMEYILGLLDVMATYKMNKLHLHLTDDEGWRLEIPGLPELTEIGARRCHDLSEETCLLPQRGSAPGLANDGTGYYSTAEYREILTYAKTRHIEVIPEIDMPGHGDAIIKSMMSRYRRYIDNNETAATEYLVVDLADQSDYRSVQRYANNSINPCVASTYTFVNHVITEIKQMHSDIQPLASFHFGGDEVASGSWEASPACEPLLNDRDLIKEFFVQNIAQIAFDAGLDLSGWEDGFMAVGSQPFNISMLPNNNKYAYAWNNIFELGLGDRAYLLANAGYKTVLAPATHFYFDHPYEPDPYDRGMFWATRLSSNYKVYGFMPDDMYENMGVTNNGRPIDKDEICATFGCPALEADKQDNIIGVQGHLWSETVRTPEHLEYMIFPRLLALAERAWHRASWETTGDPHQREEQRMADFGRFANTLGYKELARLEEMGVQFAINPPGARIAEFNRLEALSEFPGLPIQYSTDGGQTWTDYTGSQTIQPGTVHVVTRSPNGSRSSRIVELAVA